MASIFEQISSSSRHLLKVCLDTKTLVGEDSEINVFDRIKVESEKSDWLRHQLDDYRAVIHRSHSKSLDIDENAGRDSTNSFMSGALEEKRFHELREHIVQLKEDLVDLSLDKHQVDTVLRRLELNGALVEVVFGAGPSPGAAAAAAEDTSRPASAFHEVEEKQRRIQALLRARDALSCRVLRLTAEDEQRRVQLGSLMRQNADLLQQNRVLWSNERAKAEAAAAAAEAAAVAEAEGSDSLTGQVRGKGKPRGRARREGASQQQQQQQQLTRDELKQQLELETARNAQLRYTLLGLLSAGGRRLPSPAAAAAAAAAPNEAEPSAAAPSPPSLSTLALLLPHLESSPGVPPQQQL